MGVTFRGNPFEQDGEYELDDEWELTADEDWVTPPNEIFVGGDRMNFVGAILTTTLSSDDDSDWHEESVHDEYDDVNDDEDFILDEDSFLDEDEEDLMEEAVVVTAERDYYSSDLDDEIDYVTYPENPSSPEEDKATTNPNNSQSTENPNNSQSTENADTH